MLPNRLDFWNDPDRWEGVTDPHKQLFWMMRRKDVIDVRRKAEPAIIPKPLCQCANNYMQMAVGQSAYMQAQACLQATMSPNMAVRMSHAGLLSQLFSHT